MPSPTDKRRPHAITETTNHRAIPDTHRITCEIDLSLQGMPDLGYQLVRPASIQSGYLTPKAARGFQKALNGAFAMGRTTKGKVVNSYAQLANWLGELFDDMLPGDVSKFEPD